LNVPIGEASILHHTRFSTYLFTCGSLVVYGGRLINLIQTELNAGLHTKSRQTCHYITAYESTEECGVLNLNRLQRKCSPLVCSDFRSRNPLLR
jgi:hypothetical protein